MKTARIPSFSAEYALPPANTPNRAQWSSGSGSGTVVPQKPFRICYAECRSEGKPWLRCLIRCL